MIAQNGKGPFEFQFMHQEQVETLQSSRGQIARCNLTLSPPSPHTHTHTTTPSGISYPIIGGVCGIQIGLFSHLRTLKTGM